MINDKEKKKQEFVPCTYTSMMGWYIGKKVYLQPMRTHAYTSMSSIRYHFKRTALWWHCRSWYHCRHGAADDGPEKTMAPSLGCWAMLKHKTSLTLSTNDTSKDASGNKKRRLTVRNCVVLRFCAASLMLTAKGACTYSYRIESLCKQESHRYVLPPFLNIRYFSISLSIRM